MSFCAPLRRVGCHVTFSLGGEAVEARASVPDGPARVSDLIPSVQPLADAIVDVVVRDLAREGKRPTCQAGCAACCRQLVPLSQSEAVYIAELVDSMPALRQRVVRGRFAAAAGRLRRSGLLDPLRAAMDSEGPQARLHLTREYFGLQIACPFLEQEACSIYPRRPLVCREYLVTSPARACSSPEGNVDRVALPAKVSRVLYRCEGGSWGGRARWVPLVLAVEWAERHRGASGLTCAGQRLFEGFLTEFARAELPPQALHVS